VEEELLAELQRRGIGYTKDHIPYGGINDPRTRIFVYGCDIRKVLDLQEKFGLGL
jgi:hypothetical protein